MHILPYIPCCWSICSFGIREFSGNESSTEIPSEFAHQTLLTILPPNKKVNLVISKNDPFLGMGVVKKLFNRPTLFYHPLLERDAEAFKFAMRHEIHHINQSNRSIFEITKIATSLLISYSLNYFIGPLPAFVISSVSLIAQNQDQIKKEECHADTSAIDFSSIEEIKGGIRYFQAIVTINKELWQKVPEYRSYINEEGDNLTDKEHPPLSQRITILKQALEKRGESSEVDLAKLKSLISIMYRELQSSH